MAKLCTSDNKSAGAGGQSRLIAIAGGIIRISCLSAAGMTAGSIEGAGTYQLGEKALTVGQNNRSTVVSGTITGSGGKLIKVGAGTLTLRGNNTYSFSTNITGGVLSVSADTNLGGRFFKGED